MEKITHFIASIFITTIISFVIFFILFISITTYAKYTEPLPKHPEMPLGAALFSFIGTIIISLYVFYKTYKWLKKYFN